ncbi:MAG: type II secretion system protein GspM [Mariprofundaceae bacterium]|nr:type II secretion system protein GspM [Mariprofundaceae bacterium]
MVLTWAALKENWAQQYAALSDKVTLLWEDKAAPHYHALQASEQRIIKLAAVLLPLMILIFGVFLPAADQHQRWLQDVSKISADLESAQALASQIASNPAAGKNAASNSNQMLTEVDKLARETGVRSFMTRLRPQQVMGAAGRLQVQIKAVPYTKLVAFLAALAQHQLPIQSMKIQVAGEGVVHVQAVLGRS